MKPHSYCSTLVVSQKMTEVLLLKKQKGPAWLLNKWTAIGGNVEKNELLSTAAARELKEESGLEIPEDNLLHFAYVERHFTDVITRCDMFVGIHEQMHTAQSKTSEQVSAFFIEELTKPYMQDRLAYDTLWLTHMALVALKMRASGEMWQLHQVIV